MKILPIFETELNKMDVSEEYPKDFDLNQFKSIRSFRGKVRYAREKLGKPLGSGSSRIVFKVDDNKVLKLAKNHKGQSQNYVESKWGDDRLFGDILSQTFDHDEEYNFWVEMELARKTTPLEFKQKTGFELKEVYYFLRNETDFRSKTRSSLNIDKEKQERLKNSEFIKSLLDLVYSTEILCGDIGKISSWGKVTRDGEDRLVLVDFGVDKDTYSAHYQ
jgi:hypothetical protein